MLQRIEQLELRQDRVEATQDKMAGSLEEISASVKKIEGYIQTIVSIRSFLVWVMPIAAVCAWLFGLVKVG